MSILPVPYRSLDDLLASVPIAREEPETARLIRQLAHAQKKQALTRGEFLAICRWKSPRAIRMYARNSSARVRTITRQVFSIRNDRTRLELLTNLHGVGIPTASAILTLTDPRRYGVIDIRVWQLLFALRAVTTRPSGRGFTSDDWMGFLSILRHHASRLHVSVRRLELTLFGVHTEHQTGILYP